MRSARSDNTESRSNRRFALSLYLALFPTAFFLPAPYSESLLLLCAMALLYHEQRSQWASAGLRAFWAPLARLPGRVLIVPLARELGRQWRTTQHSQEPLSWWQGWRLAQSARARSWSRALLYPSIALLIFSAGQSTLWSWVG